MGTGAFGHIAEQNQRELPPPVLPARACPPLLWDSVRPPLWVHFCVLYYAPPLMSYPIREERRIITGGYYADF